MRRLLAPGLTRRMLFNSYEFILLFLPAAWIGYFVLGGRLGREPAIVWLVLASLFFYGWWNPIYLLLLLGSMVVNFVLGRALSRSLDGATQLRPGASRPAAVKVMLVAGVGFNLALLGYFKYANFFVDSVNSAIGTSYNLEHIVLPLAISFFTFQQITYLVDASKGLAREYSATHYALFVTFFPQLIAGPIVHHREMLPQFARRDALKPRLVHLAVGLTIFSIGLFKKAVLADGVAVYATPVFDGALNGEDPGFILAWTAALAYTFQLYFDFSGYSDMAIGIARMFGIRLPLNFFSPYKATSIVEFWRRWHMTLSRFLRDYLYIGLLGGNRQGPARRYTNLMTTMLLGGLWHGAGWTFVAWGGLHGFYLVACHFWRWLLTTVLRWPIEERAIYRAVAWTATFLAVVVGWVFFRAESFDAALRILHGMAGFNGVTIPNAIASRMGGAFDLLAALGVGVDYTGGSNFVRSGLWLIGLFLIALLMPNTAEIMERIKPALSSHRSLAGAAIEPLRRLAARLRWTPSPAWACGIGLMAMTGLLSLSEISEFLYFQF